MVKWDTVELISLSDGGMQNGVFYEVSRKGNGIPIINVGDMYTQSPITSANLELFDATDDEIERFAVNDGDLFFTRSSVVPSGIAFCNWFKQTKKTPVLFDSHVIRFKTDKSKVDPMFLYLECISAQARRYFISNAKSATMTTIDQALMGKCPIPFPSIPEQRRIAEAISDIDTLIASLEKLIAKKKAVKQGAMQELLTGKKRLSEFSGEWVEKKLIEMADFYDNLRVPVTESKREVGTVPYYGANGIQGYVKGYTHDGEFVLIAEDGANSLSNYPIMYFYGKAWVNNHAHVIQGINGKASTRFLSYVLKTVDYFQILVGGTRSKLNGSVAKEIIIKVPLEVSEQTAIATILSDMDSEISDLEEKLSKYRNIKTGMMQTLLTGRIRLSEQGTPVEAVAPPKVTEQQKPEAKGHNQPFDDAVAIAAIVNAFYSDKYPLGRKKVQKLLYLLRRRQDASTAAFKKKAAGPYADEVRYKGGEPIAKRNNYVTVNNSKQGSMFAKGKEIGKALDYVAKWEMQELDWLMEQFLHTKVDTLELLATIDMAMCDLENSGVTPSVDSVKKLIASDKEWKAKLKKTYFSDTDIGWAITECLGFFDSTGR